MASVFGVERDWSKSVGSGLVEAAARSFVPRVVGFRVGSLEEDKAGADYVMETPSSEIRIEAKFRRRDYRAVGEDDLALEVWSNKGLGLVGWTGDRSKKTDLVVWVWQDTGRMLAVPFGPLREAFLANVNEWCHNCRTEEQMSQSGQDYWVSECVFVPVHLIKDAMRPHLLYRDGIDLSYCEPPKRFCRQPNCTGIAWYPMDKGDRPLWCNKHWDELREGKPQLTVIPDVIGAESKGPFKPSPKVRPMLHMVEGGQENLF